MRAWVFESSPPAWARSPYPRLRQAPSIEGVE